MVLPADRIAVCASTNTHNEDDHFFPTPPFAARALMHDALGCEFFAGRTVWEPACGAGHLSEPLSEICKTVISTDRFDRGYGSSGPDYDFLSMTRWEPDTTVDWIITNPPFGRRGLRFILRALDYQPNIGCAFIVQTRHLEGITRFRQLYLPQTPTVFFQFVERVPMHRDVYDPSRGTATAYGWMVWLQPEYQHRFLSKQYEGAECRTRWLAPGQGERHFKQSDLSIQRKGA